MDLFEIDEVYFKKADQTPTINDQCAMLERRVVEALRKAEQASARPLEE